MVTPGARLEEVGDGSLRVVDRVGAGRGDEVATAPTPLMWDSSEDPATGDPAVEVVDLSVEQSSTPSGTPIGTIALRPAAEFLADPNTVYPVTIDPTFVLLAQVDTWVSSTYTSSQSGSPELRAGRTSSGQVARSYLKFPGDATWDGTQIISADLTLRNWESSSCAGAAVRAQRLLEPFNSTTISWSTQPEASNFYSADYVAAHGATGCSVDDASWNIKDMVQAWADDNLDNNGLRLRAVDESDTNTFRRYRSLEYGNVRPKITVTYSEKPEVPIVTGFSPGTEQSTYSFTPDVRLTATDADSANLTATLKISKDGDDVWTETASVVSGVEHIEPIPAGILEDRVLYDFTTSISDGYSASSETRDLFVAVTGEDPTLVDAEGEDPIPTELASTDGITGDDWTVAYIDENGNEIPFEDDPEPANGVQFALGTWWDGQCPGNNGSDRYRSIKTYWRRNDHSRMIGTDAYLDCGKTANSYWSDGSLRESKFGLRHIRDRHRNDYLKLVRLQGSENWGQFMHWMVSHTISEPDKVTNQGSTRFCYISKFVFKSVNNERIYKANVVILGKTGRRIMTAFPRNNMDYCAGTVIN